MALGGVVVLELDVNDLRRDQHLACIKHIAAATTLGHGANGLVDGLADESAGLLLGRAAERGGRDVAWVHRVTLADEIVDGSRVGGAGGR